jgi:hypothetical protein
MTDGLYILNQWVADVPLALTLQANVLTDPAALHSSYSNSVSLPDSLDIRALTGQAQRVDSMGEDPYRLLPAKAVWHGRTVFSGIARLKQFSAGWQVELSETKANLFDQLGDKSLQSLDMSRFDHNWNLSTMQVLNVDPDVVVYPLIDYGTIEGGIVPSDTMFPAVTVRGLITQMLAESDYRPTGDWLSDKLLNQAAVPFTEESPTAVDDEWVKDRTARVTVTDTEPLFMINGKLDQIIPFEVDSPVSAGWVNGKLGNFKTTTHSYIPDTAVRLDISVSQSFTMKVDIGTVEVKLQVEKNGELVAQERFTKAAPSGQKPYTVSLNTSLDLKAGDVVQIRRIVQKSTLIGQFQGLILNDSSSVFASFIPDPVIQYGDKWPVSRNLPDMKCLDLFCSVAFMTSAVWDVDDLRKTVRLVPLNDTLALTPDDWSEKVTDAEPTYVPSLEPYAQKNLLKYKEIDGVEKGFGDGFISCQAQSLKAEETLFTLPFAATMQSKQDIAGYGKPLLIETRTVTTSAGNTSITRKSTTPRIILVQPGHTTNVSTKILGDNGLIENSTCSLMACWFSIRPLPISQLDNAFSLAFDAVVGQFTEQSMIDRYFAGLRRILRRPRTLTVSMYLRPSDVADLQAPDNDGNIGLMRPKRLRNVRMGSMSLSQSEFIINKIPDIQDGQPCQVTLIAY